jgi:hypothetical protein
MNTPDERPALHATFRELTLTLLGIFDLYGADPALVTATARGLADVFHARVPELLRPRAARGRAALRALLHELERTNDDEPH